MTTRRTTRVFAVLGVLSMLGFLAAGTIAAISIHHGFSARDQPSWLEAKIARAMRRWAVPIRAKQLVNPVSGTREDLADARAHWADHCASCHANDGSGDTSIGRNLYPKAPDMRAAPTQDLSDGELYYVIQNGIRLSGMPAWGQAVDDDEDSWRLVTFIRHLSKLTPDELRQMTKLNPKSPDEWREEQQEEEFLRGEDEKTAEPDPGHQHHH